MKKTTAANLLIGGSFLALVATGAFAAGPETTAPNPAPPAATGDDNTIPPPVGVGIAPGVVPGARPGPAMQHNSSSEKDSNADWPCIQRKVMTITPAQIWDGPSIDGLTGWDGNEKISDLIPILLSRRVPQEDAEKAIKQFAESYPDAERDKMLTMLFAGFLSSINSDRQFVIRRVEEFQRRQAARSKELEREGVKLAELNQDIPATEQLGPRDTSLSPEQQEYNWNARIFQERQQNLTVACEIPVLIEQRAYAISQLIRAQMSN